MWCLVSQVLVSATLSPRDFPGKNTGVGCHFLLQGIVPTQGLIPGLPIAGGCFNPAIPLGLLRKPKFKKTHISHCSLQHYLQQLEHGNNLDVHQQMDKEVLVHIHNGILFSHTKEHIWISSNEMDESRAYYTEWNKSEREKQILYISVYMWNLEKWCWWTYILSCVKWTTDEKLL